MNINKQNILPNYLLDGKQTTLATSLSNGGSVNESALLSNSMLSLPAQLLQGPLRGAEGNKGTKYIVKGLNITVNDNKKLIPLFEGRFQQFEIRNKGTDLNSPEAIIKILNSRPRSFLNILESLVLPFKNIDRNINNYCKPAYKAVTPKGKKAHPKRIAYLTKDITSAESTNSLLLMQSATVQGNSAMATLNSVEALDLNGKTVKSDLLTKKIDSLTQVLKDNKLTMPFNLLKPLVTKSIFSNPSTPNNLKAVPALALAQMMSGKALAEGLPIVNNLEKTNGDSIRKSKYLEMFMPFSYINPYQQNIHFNFNASNNKKIHNLFGLLEYAFIAMSCLISKPVYTETPDKINIHLFYFLIASASAIKQNKMNKPTAPIATSYNGIEIKNVTQPSELAEKYGFGIGNNNKGMNTKLAGNRAAAASVPLSATQAGGVKSINPIKLFTQSNIQKLNLLCLILSRIFKKPVELDLIRLHLPYFDDNILVKAIGIMSKEVNARNIFNIIFTKTKISTLFKNPLKSSYSSTGGVNSYLGGIKIRIGGRLMTQRVIPRLTTRVTQKGAITRGKINYINSSRVNLKNKRGAHSITVTMTHLI